MNNILYTALIATGLSVLAYLIGFKQGYSKSQNDYEKERISLIENQIKREKALQQALDELNRSKYTELLKRQTEIDKLKRDVRNANKRLSVKVSSCTVKDTSSSRVGNEEARAYIDEGTATDIIGIVARGDEAIMQLNTLQEWAREVTKDSE